MRLSFHFFVCHLVWWLLWNCTVKHPYNAQNVKAVLCELVMPPRPPCQRTTSTVHSCTLIAPLITYLYPHALWEFILLLKEGKVYFSRESFLRVCRVVLNIASAIFQCTVQIEYCQIKHSNGQNLCALWMIIIMSVTLNVPANLLRCADIGIQPNIF